MGYFKFGRKVNVRLKSTFPFSLFPFPFPTNKAGIDMVAWSLNYLFWFIFFGDSWIWFWFCLLFYFWVENVIGLSLNHVDKFVYIIADDNKHYGMCSNNILFAHHVESTIISVVYCNEKCPKMLIWGYHRNFVCFLKAITTISQKKIYNSPFCFLLYQIRITHCFEIH